MANFIRVPTYPEGTCIPTCLNVEQIVSIVDNGAHVTLECSGGQSYELTRETYEWLAKTLSVKDAPRN